MATRQQLTLINKLHHQNSFSKSRLTIPHVLTMVNEPISELRSQLSDSCHDGSPATKGTGFFNPVCTFFIPDISNHLAYMRNYCVVFLGYIPLAKVALSSPALFPQLLLQSLLPQHLRWRVPSILKLNACVMSLYNLSSLQPVQLLPITYGITTPSLIFGSPRVTNHGPPFMFKLISIFNSL